MYRLKYYMTTHHVKCTYGYAFPKSVFSNLFLQEISTPGSSIYWTVWFTLYQCFSATALLTFWTRYVFVVSTVPGLYPQLMVTDIPPPVVATKHAFRPCQMSPRGKLCPWARTTVLCGMRIWGMLAYIW